MEWILTNDKQNQQLKEAKEKIDKILDEISYEYDNYGPIWNAANLISKAVQYEKYLE